MAPNISLQNLILSANEKNEVVIKQLKAKQEQMVKNNQFEHMNSAKVNTEVNVDKYLNDHRLLDIRCSVLEEERTEYQRELQETKT